MGFSAHANGCSRIDTICHLPVSGSSRRKSCGRCRATHPRTQHRFGPARNLSGGCPSNAWDDPHAQMRSRRRLVTNGACTHGDGRLGGVGRKLLPIETETVMAGTQDTPSGPDLAQGVAFDQIADGAMLAGRVDGEAVLVVHRGDELFAVGAT